MQSNNLKDKSRPGTYQDNAIRILLLQSSFANCSADLSVAKWPVAWRPLWLTLTPYLIQMQGCLNSQCHIPIDLSGWIG